MNKALEDMLQAYNPGTPLDWLHATREITQEIALLGFWRTGFFEQAAFYGGTALRIFHELNRFSEDLDFSLTSQHDETRLESALSSLEEELAAWGFSFESAIRPSQSVCGKAACSAFSGLEEQGEGTRLLRLYLVCRATCSCQSPTS